MTVVNLTSPMVLHADPVQDSHANTKRYVDNKRASPQASWFSSGLIPTARLPALTGDISSDAGTALVTLNNSGVVPGSYPKVQLDSAGRVTGGVNLIASDISSVKWSSVASGKPTSASGYGITNTINLSGGTVSGAVASTATPTSNLDCVSKGYVDTKAAQATGLSVETGTIVRKPVSVSPTGFLRCNGATVQISQYNNLYTALGGSESSTPFELGSGKPWKYQYDINTTGTLGAWATAGSFPIAVTNTQAVVTKNRVYVLGGVTTGTTQQSSARYAVINADGTLGSWVNTTSLPKTISYSQALVARNRVYILGGLQAGVYGDTIYSCPINSDGTLGTWAAFGTLPYPLAESTAFITKNKMYLIGGTSGGSMLKEVISATINNDGTLGAWTTETQLPVYLITSEVIVTKNRVYLLGGVSEYGVTNTILTCSISSNGTLGAWSVAPVSLPVTLQNSQVVTTRNKVYVLGGVQSGAVSSNVLSADINVDGTLGSFSNHSTLPGVRHNSIVVVTAGKVLLIAGHTGSVYQTTIFSGALSGALNDYSSCYAVPTAPVVTTFNLPDFTASEADDINFYVKY